MKSSEGNHPKGRRFTSENNFAPKQKGINTALTFAPLCVKTKERRKKSPKRFQVYKRK